MMMPYQPTYPFYLCFRKCSHVRQQFPGFVRTFQLLMLSIADSVFLLTNPDTNVMHNGCRLQNQLSSLIHMLCQTNHTGKIMYFYQMLYTLRIARIISYHSACQFMKLPFRSPDKFSCFHIILVLLHIYSCTTAVCPSAFFRTSSSTFFKLPTNISTSFVESINGGSILNVYCPE